VNKTKEAKHKLGRFLVTLYFIYLHNLFKDIFSDLPFASQVSDA